MHSPKPDERATLMWRDGRVERLAGPLGPTVVRTGPNGTVHRFRRTEQRDDEGYTLYVEDSLDPPSRRWWF